MGSTTLSPQPEQEALLRGFLAEALGEGGRGGSVTIGEAMVAAQRRAAGESSGGRPPDTARCYSVLGDPATPLVDAAVFVPGDR